MAEILGVGLTHSTSLIKPDTERDFSITRSLRNPNLTERASRADFRDFMLNERKVQGQKVGIIGGFSY